MRKRRGIVKGAIWAAAILPLVALLSGCDLFVQNPGGVCTQASCFTQLDTFDGIGVSEARIMGPGPADAAGQPTQWYYSTYTYQGGSFDLVAVDPAHPESPHVFHSPVAAEQGADGLLAGPDNMLYVGTLPDADLMRLDPQTGQFTTVTQIPHEEYIWGLTESSYYQQQHPQQGRIYGCTYPSANLFAYDTATGNLAQFPLGSDRLNEYARTCIADPNPNNPYIYIGLGTHTAEIVAFNVETDTATILLSGNTADFGRLLVASDGYVYGTIGAGWYKLNDGTATFGYPNQPENAAANRFTVGPFQGYSIAIDDQKATVTLCTPLSAGAICTKTPYHYAGKGLEVFRLTLGEDGSLYGSSVLPAYLLKINPGTRAVTSLGYLGDGEIYSFLPYQGKIYMAGYYSVPWGIYDPRTFSANSILEGSDTTLPFDWRPEAILYDSNDGHIYVGSIPGYGEDAGYLYQFDPNNVTLHAQFPPIPDLSVVSLAQVGPYLAGGTSIILGSGVAAAQDTAKLYFWNPTSQAVAAAVTVPSATDITDLIASHGNLYGLAATAGGYQMVWCSAAGNTLCQSLQSSPANFPGKCAPISNSIALGPDGNLWGIATCGVFTINLQHATPGIQLVARHDGITGGFALDQQHKTIYFSSTDVVWSYALFERSHSIFPWAG